jgi:hypothetical protein
VDALRGRPGLGKDASGRKKKAREVYATTKLIDDELRPAEITQARVAV